MDGWIELPMGEFIVGVLICVAFGFFLGVATVGAVNDLGKRSPAPTVARSVNHSDVCWPSLERCAQCINAVDLRNWIDQINNHGLQWEKNMHTTFNRYHKGDEDYIFVAQVGEDDAEPIRNYWKKDEVKVGDFIQLQPNGDLKIFDKEEFEKDYQRKE